MEGGSKVKNPPVVISDKKTTPFFFIFSHTEKPRGKWLCGAGTKETQQEALNMSFGHITLMHLQAHLVWLKWFPVLLLLNSILCCWQYERWVFWATHNHNGRWTHNEREYYCKLIKESFSFFFNESRGHDSAITPTHTTLTEYLSRHWQLVDPKAWGKGGWVGISIRISLHVAVLSAI
jgi:hypothetical protein